MCRDRDTRINLAPLRGSAPRCVAFLASFSDGLLLRQNRVAIGSDLTAKRLSLGTQLHRPRPRRASLVLHDASHRALIELSETRARYRPTTVWRWRENFLSFSIFRSFKQAQVEMQLNVLYRYKHSARWLRWTGRQGGQLVRLSN